MSNSLLHSGRTGVGPPLRSFKFPVPQKLHVDLGGDGVAKPRLKPLRTGGEGESDTLITQSPQETEGPSLAHTPWAILLLLLLLF